MAPNPPETVTIKYDNHSQVLIEGLWNFLNTKYRVDDVAWGGGLLKAHQLILDVFLPPERLLGVVTMSSDLHCHLEALLEFLYRGTVDVKRDNLDGLLQLAKELDFQMLVDAAVASRPRKNVSNVVSVSTNDDGDVPENHMDTAQKSAGYGSYRSSRLRRMPAKKRPWEPAIEILDVGDEGNEAILTGGDKVSKENSLASCPLVPKRPKRQVAIRRSSVVRSKPAPKHKCAECEFESTNAHVLKSHQAVVHTKAKPLKCAQCSFTTCWRGILQHHVTVLHCTEIKKSDSRTSKRLTSERASTGTSKLSLTKTSLRPKRTKTSSAPEAIAIPEGLDCDVCGKRSKNRFLLARHMRSHALDRPFKCTHCERRFYSKINMAKHVAGQHTDIPGGFTCKVCGTAFKTRDEIAKHRRLHSLEKRFQCPHCPKRFTSMSVIREHVQRVHTEGPGEHACDVCQKRFKTHAGLREHRKIHRTERPYLCQHCGKGFSRPRLLKSHVANIHSPVTNAGRFVCETCGKSMKSRGIMIEHQRIHTQETPYKCPHCEKGFRTSSHRSKHIVSAHTEGPGEFECDICRKRYKTRHYLKKHQLIHTNERPFKCPQCERCFNSSSHRSKHIKSAHTQTHESFPCEICGKILKSRPGLVEHRRTHTQEKPFKCPHCDRRFNQSSNRIQHIKKAHTQGAAPPAETLVCETCGKQVSSRRALYEHRQTHNPEKLHKCPQCDYTTFKKYLPTHLDVVHGIGPGRYTCEICGRRCASQRMLDRHNLSHTKEKPFKCDQCPYAASQKCSLKGHVDAVHGPGRFRCEVCDKVLRSANQLTMHRRMHTQEKPFACPHCDHRSSRKNNMDSHIEVVHGQGSKKSTCPTCGESLKSASQLARHRRTHAKEKKAREKLKPSPPLVPECCPHCSHTSVDRASLEEHVRLTHGPAQFACDVCGERRSSMEDLTDHRRNHSSAYPFDLFRFQSMHHL